MVTSIRQAVGARRSHDRGARMKLTPRQLRGRRALKRFMYSMLYMRDMFQLMLGRAKPLVPFKVEADPPSIYLNWELDPARVAELQAELDLPFPLAKIRCVAGEEAFYCLTLNIYRVSGLTNGIRAEWSLYIEDPDGRPRYMVVEAQADAGSLDSVDLFTQPAEVTHREEGDTLASVAASDEGGRFESTITNRERGPLVDLHGEWVEANDYIYWRSGVCDRTFYDSGLARPTARLVEDTQIKWTDTTRWNGIVRGEPRHVIVFENAIEFAMSPWWNVDELPD